MDKKAKKFQRIAITISGIIFVFAVLVFAQIIPIGRSNQAPPIAGNVTIWGTLPPSYFISAIEDLEEENDTLSIEYVQKGEATFDRDIVEALAIGAGPDIFVVSHDKIVQYQNKIIPIRYESLPKQTFQSQYVDIADLLLSGEGILGLPFILDPLVMYYNKNLLSSKFIVEPPEYWDEFLGFSEQVTEAASVSVDLSAVALGSFDNINNAKDILSAMFLQTRNPITMRRGRGMTSVLAQDFTSIRDFTAQVVAFYTSFTDPTKTHYSWNTGLRSSRDAFLAEELAVYFGYASEARDFVRINPNINVGVALLPQLHDMPKATYATLQTMMINRGSQNPQVAFQVMQALTGPQYGVGLSLGLQLPPVYTNRLSTRPSDEEYLQTFYNSAIISRAWLDPQSDESGAAIRRMIRDVNAGLLAPQSAVVRAGQAISKLFPEQSYDLETGTAFDE